MSLTFVSFTPLDAVFPASNFPELKIDGQRRPVLAYNDSTDETAYFHFIAPQNLTGTLVAVITFRMASATADEVIFNAAIEAISAGDSLDTDAASSFDTDNASAATTVPGTAGFLGQISITLTNKDSIAPGDSCRLRIVRDADNAGDDATGDAEILNVELRHAA
jgi:hypothetical protein